MIRMKQLTVSLEAAGFRNVTTYIQSGNVVCRSRHRSSSAVQRAVAKVVQADFGISLEVLVLSSAQLDEAVAGCPFDSDDEKSIHFFFLQQPAVTGCESVLKELAAAREHWQLTDSVFYLYAPDGIGRSRLAANAERRLSVTTTARNFRTVRRLVAMCGELQ